MSTRWSPRRGALLSLYVAMAFLTVHVGGFAFFDERPIARSEEATKPAADGSAELKPTRKYTGSLPPAVVDMREAILAAVDMGDIAELKHAIELNELKPDFGDEAKADPIAFWKTVSADGEGREVLAQLADLLSLPPTKVALGKNPENTAVFVWPYLAELAPDTLKPGELVDAFRLVSPSKLKEMIAAKRWTEWRLVISADGTWVSFKR